MASNEQKHWPGSRQTTILVNNLHCPSCVVNIEETLSALDPPPLSISTSIVLHDIKIVHLDKLSTSRIIRALADAAFEIDSVLPPSDSEDFKLHDASRLNPRETYLQKLHAQKCDECTLRQDGPLSGALGSTEVEALPIKDSSESTVSASSRDVDLTSINTGHCTSSLTRITLAINGMSCSLCVSKIVGAIQEKPWVRTADVNLLTSTASVVLLDGARVDEVLRTVREAGYNADVVDREEIQPPKQIKPTVASADIWRATYAIGGMSCSSCVGKVTDALNY
jgi:Cu+-exporting ATPase